ncbi:siderophore-interacting protein [Mycobacterium antarcticum]|uniref:siderophore-interacting protein n=1 Tax=unclassified Mycolicibacterium TaxID=2636767 RepID=UPI0023A5C51E|nr:MULTISPECIES: siderophore-interacting protein [unclassified Mycolicibacterium]BDX34937.1 siderophore-interacting protein [Mycolicibacterium sp. TUM20985]GLP78161.1 siderophore-interacting protein [Mycolicibacterium sp. TUM20983]
MTTADGFVAEVSDVGPRMRRVVFDVPRITELRLPGAGDEALGVYFSDGTEGRNYSVRRRGPGEHQITCDFVIHQHGLASDWARRARVGDRVRLDHARSWYRPAPSTRWQLLVADLSGLPALARILDELPAGAEASVILEVADDSDVAYLPARPDVPMVVTVGTGNGYAPSKLGELVRGHAHPDGRGYCWFAGEAGATRGVRKQLRREHGWHADQYDVVGYWRFDSETWDRRYEAVGEEMLAVYERALAEGKGAKVAAEEYDEALERVGL